MENALAERTVTLEVAGRPVRSIRMMIGKPEMMDENAWRVPYEVHGPGPDEIERREVHGVDAWQALRLAFWFVPEVVVNRVPAGSRLTFLGDDNWSCDRTSPPPP
jgi:hypothetical protein